MRVEHIGRSAVKITLSGKELARAGLTVSDIDGKSPLSVMLLSGLIEKIYPGGGSSQLNIEVFAAKDGGCVLYISDISPSAKAAATVKTIITVYSVDDLVSVCRIVSKAGICPKNSAVIGEKGRLRLVVGLPADQPALISELLAFSWLENADDHALAHILEHGRVMIPQNAVDIASRLAVGGV